MNPLLVSVPEAGQALGIGKRLAWELVYSGELASVRVGRRRLVPVAELERFVSGQLQDAQGQRGGGLVVVGAEGASRHPR